LILPALLLSFVIFFFLIVNSCTSDTSKFISAAGDGNISKVKKLLSKGTEVNAKDEYGTTALISASTRGHADIVKMLLDKDADMNAKNNDGYTALKEAEEYGRDDIVQLLKNAGAKE
jgi:uncharacterized protein